MPMTTAWPLLVWPIEERKQTSVWSWIFAAGAYFRKLRCIRLRAHLSDQTVLSIAARRFSAILPWALQLAEQDPWRVNRMLVWHISSWTAWCAWTTPLCRWFGLSADIPRWLASLLTISSCHEREREHGVFSLNVVSRRSLTVSSFAGPMAWNLGYVSTEASKWGCGSWRWTPTCTAHAEN